MDTAFIDRLDKLSPYARQLLLNPAELIQAPIRAELFGAGRFAEHGRSLASAQPVKPFTGAAATTDTGPTFFPRMEENIAALRMAYDYIAVSSRRGHYVTPAAQWLLDNFHLIEAQLQQIEEGVSQRYYADLPKLAERPLEGLPRVYGIAWAYIAHTDSVLDAELFTSFLHAYQEVSELTLGELWALPTTLRVVLLENLRRMADRIAWNKVAREIAHAVWDSANQLTTQDLDELLATLRQRGLERSFLTQLWQSLPTSENPAETTSHTTELARWTEKHCPDALDLISEGQIAQVAANLTVGNIITTLRLIGQVEWSELIEPVSHSLQVLRRLPSFSQESEGTRQQITRAMERLARTTGNTEQAVARAVLRAAEQADQDPASHTAGYFLLDSGGGRAQLEASLLTKQPDQAPRSLGLLKAQLSQPNRLALYAAAWLAGTAALLVSAVHPLTGLHWASWVALALMAWPASEAVAALMYRLIAESTRIQPLPRLDFSTGIPPEHRTLVVIPTLLTSAQANTDLVNRLELHWLASREAHVQFALLTDWTDADEANAPSDEALLDDAHRQITELNQRYPLPDGGVASRFVLLHRGRSWSPTEGRWIGWERKRGKLELLIRLLAQSSAIVADHVFLPAGSARQLHSGIRYIVTLDSDTGLPPGALRALVSIAAHPLNTPHITPAANGAGARVRSGYGILQPRVATPLPLPGERSLFHAWFVGQCGLDPYSSGTSDLYQDLFGQGTFTGKGLLHVAAMHAVLDDTLPHDAVLSHDLLEGSIARCGYVGDVALLEDHPHHAGVAASRVHRWTRGDWQLLPLMLRARNYGIDALGLWRMADNLRRSTVAPMSLLLLVWVIFTAAVPLGTALAVVLAAFVTGPLLGALAGLIPTRRGIAWAHFFDVGLRDAGRGIAQALWQFSQLMPQARLLLDAISRALWRMAASRRQLLQWTTAAQAQAAARYTLITFVQQHGITSALALGLALAALFSPHPWLGTTLFLMWALAPVSAWWVSVPAGPANRLNEADQGYLQTLARQTWGFFEECVGEEDHFLPPDNVQMEPERTVAHRTSPTNIGLYLLAAACAREFGWITTSQLVARLQATLGSMDQLAKHDGHLFNWYDTRTLQVLAPAYVSTVDSGNLAGHLLTTAQACRQLAGLSDTTPDEADSLRALAQRCTAMCMAMDFSGLYSAKRHLFHIGLRADSQALDSSYYDLLASESRLTSFLAIAKGDVPRRHWQALGRPFLSVGVMPGLKSWSGSMFEYLMPCLVMTEPELGLLHQSSLAAVREQQAFGQSQQIPWGISESAYFAQDHTLAYQYGPFGAPRLALRSTPPTDRVVAPYASILATQFTPVEAVANLQALEQLGMRGHHGFMDAVDFTVSRQPTAEHTETDGHTPHQVVANFMAHHQGMSLVALCNVLCKEAPRRWFSASPLVQAYEALLHENTPRQIVDAADPRVVIEPPDGASQPVYQSRQVLPASGLWQPVQLLSNGRYSVALRANGAGASRWSPGHGSQTRQVSRWRDDALRDAYGTFIYLRHSGDSQLSSVTLHPAPHPDWHYKATFLADRVEFDTSTPDLHAKTSVLVSPEDDTELRTLRLQNHSDHDITLDVMSCFEPVMADARADEAHPAFSNLFITTTWQPEWRALMLHRKPRLQGEPGMAVAHFLADSKANVRAIDYIADRRSFLGRNQSPSNPAAHPVMHGPDALLESPHTQTANNQLDPACGLRLRIRIAAGGKARLTFATAVADTTAELEARIDKYLQPMHVKRSARMAATLAQVRLRDLGVVPEENAALQDLTTALMYACSRPPQATPATADRSLVNQRLLWRFGLSGDKPIVLVRIHAMIGLPLVQTLLRAQPLWRFGGQAMDLVILNSEVNAYLMPLHRDIQALHERTHQQTANSFPASDAVGFFLLREHEVSVDEKAALNALARVVLVADGRPLDVQLDALLHAPLAARQTSRAANAPRLLPAAGTRRPAPQTAPTGHFDARSGEFQFDLAAGQTTPRPWINVIANATFGFQVSEAGAGYTWAVNSRLHQLTPWSNDPVGDARGEHYLLQDLDRGELLALTPNSPTVAQPPGTPNRAVTHPNHAVWQHAPNYRVRHGQGYSTFEAAFGQLQVQTTFFADAVDPVKVVQIAIHYTGTAPRRLRAIGMAEWQLGAARHDRRTVRTWAVDMSPTQGQTPTVFAQQRERRAGFGGNTAFLSLLAPLAAQPQWTCDRSEFFSAAGEWQAPEQMARRSGLALDPCAALSAQITLQPGQRVTLAFVLGHAADAAQAELLATQWAQANTAGSLAAVQKDWAARLNQVTISTPDPLFDALVNHWLLYQTLTSRLWSKAGFYQAGGAFGFRDQLQDAMAFAVVEPARLRAQIVLNASRQFPEGDVQHWWHAPGGEGVRTHFSDDLLWLPYASAHYVSVTGDHGLLDEAVPFIEGAQIPEGAEDAYYPPDISTQTASVYEHGARTLDRSLRLGVHGLPLMGTGDWNDGMNRVGHEGRGESVWLAWFLCRVVTDFAPLAEARGDTERAATWRSAREGWITALHSHGWDGDWFKRAFFDNGAVLGSHANDECRIDLIAQAWSVLSGASAPEFTAPAMSAMNRELIDPDAGLLHLLAPPFAASANNPGYIQAYPPGVRENGGQYSHAGVWALMAQAQTGDAEAAWQSFQSLSPAHRSAHPIRGPVYELEPYVMAGDVYGSPPYVGRGGWSWYTGSAAWLYRAAFESLLGLRIEQGQFSLKPCVPAHWPSFEVTLQLATQMGRTVTVRWQRAANPAGDSPAPDRVVSPGERVALAELPPQAVVLVVQDE